MSAETIKSQAVPIFTIIAAVFAAICLTTPLFLVSVPLMATAGMAIVAIVRHERPRWVAVGILALAGLIFFSASAGPGAMASSGSQDLSAVKMIDSSWDIDRDYGTDGTVRYRTAIRNLTDKSISNVKVDFSSYDKQGKLLASTFTYVDAIPPGETRTREGFADLYGTEDKADIRVTEVHFSGE